MAEKNAQTTRGQMIGDKPPEVRTVYGPDGKPHVCSPLDAREILAAGAGYTAEPPAPQAPLTGEAIIDQAYAEVEKLKAEREQQPEQQPKSDDLAAGTETGSGPEVKPDAPSSADAGSKTSARSRNKSAK